MWHQCLGKNNSIMLQDAWFIWKTTFYMCPTMQQILTTCYLIIARYVEIHIATINRDKRVYWQAYIFGIHRCSVAVDTQNSLPKCTKHWYIPEYLFQSESELHHVVSKACGLLLSPPRDMAKWSQSPGLQINNNKKKGKIIISKP